MKKAYLIEKKHFKYEEVNFKNLSSMTNNVILEYVYEKDNKYFKRSLFELDRLGFNIGILVRISRYEDRDVYLKDLIDKIKGFNIKLGVWIDLTYPGDYKDYYESLIKNFNNNFITGIKGEYQDNLIIPKWGYNKDIEEIESIKLDFIKDDITVLRLNTNYKEIYDENNLHPIPSTIDINSIF